MSHSDAGQPGTYYAPRERTFHRFLTPLEAFLHDQSAGGLLLACTVIALGVANSPLAATYDHVLHTYVGFSIGGGSLKHSVHHWINDGLMALFFFLVGLEIKREGLVGQPSDLRAALLPVIAAIGGMAAPAIIYVLVVGSGEGLRGWGVPMATDIALAVGVLALLGNRVPKALPTLLVAVAIVDDIGAVAVIARFYTEEIVMQALAAAGLFFAVLVAFDRLGIRKPAPYFIVGVLMWMAMLEPGVHATIAGILAAMAIPARAKYDPARFSDLMRRTADRLDARQRDPSSLDEVGQRRACLQTMENGVHLAEAPLQRLEHRLHIPVAFVIISLFALASAGVPIDAGSLGLAAMPTGTLPLQLLGVDFLGGIGFTLSIFIAELAFTGQQSELVMSETGILCASLTAGVIGLLWLRRLGNGRGVTPA